MLIKESFNPYTPTNPVAISQFHHSNEDIDDVTALQYE
jgi:hypothetical protein